MHTARADLRALATVSSLVDYRVRAFDRGAKEHLCPASMSRRVTNTHPQDAPNRRLVLGEQEIAKLSVLRQLIRRQPLLFGGKGRRRG